MRLPEFLTELSPVRETLAALEQGENAMAEAVAEKNGQVCVETATGGLTLWERDYGLPVREGAAVEDRRAAVRAAMAGGRTLTPAFLKELCVTLGGGDRGEVEEDFAHWSVTALAVGAGRVPADIPALKRAVERLKPAHLSVTVLPTADLTAHRWEAVTGGVMMEVKERGETGEAPPGRMKRACFEDGHQTADMQYPLFGLGRRCIPAPWGRKEFFDTLKQLSQTGTARSAAAAFFAGRHGRFY